MTDTIVKIQPSDLISDSMLKINHNFEIISNRDDVTESKLNQWAESIETQLNDIRNENGIISDALLNNVQKLENKINNATDLDGIVKEVQNIVNNATIDVENLINDKAGEAISSRLGDYVKTSTLNEKLDGYVASTVFDTYRSDSSKSLAQSSKIVANSKFLKLPNGDDECLVKIGGEITGFKSVEDYFTNGLSPSEKEEILGGKTFDSNDKALEDPDIVANLIKKCEETFKTVVTEMSTITQTVGPDNVENTIIATVKGGKKGEDITASIFAKANNDGSEITLNADNILIDSNHTLNVQSGGNINIESDGNFKINSGGKFQITSDNFNIDSNGNVRVKGAIEATSLTITSGSSAETTLKSFIEGVGTEKHWGDATEPYADGWLTNAFSKTTISGGLALTGNIFAADSKNNVTAGMMGGNVENKNDIRFFAGDATPENAPFKVYEDGSIIASKGRIGGLKISDNGSLTTENGNFSVSSDGNLIAKSGVFSGFLRMPFKTFDEGAPYDSSDSTYTVKDYFNLTSLGVKNAPGYEVTLKLPNSSDYDGAVLTIFDSPYKTRSTPQLTITCESGTCIYHPSNKKATNGGLEKATSITCPYGGLIQFVCVDGCWVVVSDAMPDAVVS